MKCFNNVFSLTGLNYNIGCYIILFLFLISIICMIYFYRKGIISFISKIESLVKIEMFKKFSVKTKKELIKKKNNNKFESKNNLIHLKDENYLKKNNILTLNEIDKSKINPNRIKKKKKIKKQVLKGESVSYLNDYELNSLDYEKALTFDKRSFFECYYSLVRTKQIILFTFFNKSDYNSLPIKIILFSLSLALFYSTNALFFTDATMHKIYIDHGIYDFFYQLPQILYSTIISTIIDSIISYLSLTEESISELKQTKSESKIEEKEKLIKCIKIKFIFFFILNFLFFVLMWYYLSAFCAVYKNTQIFLLKDTLISYATSLVYPFLYNFIPCIVRTISLRAKNKDKNYLYKISKFLQIF